MVDTRFHRFSGPTTIGAILSAIGQAALAVDLVDPARVIEGAAELDVARAGDVALAAHGNYRDMLQSTQAGVVIVLPELRDVVPKGTVAVEAARPHEVFATILDLLYPANTRMVLSASGSVSDQAFLEADVLLGPGVALGSNVEIGRGTVIGANSVVGNGVTIGRNCIIGANTTIDCAHVGNDVIIHSGVRIGTEGFGWLDFGRTNRKVPQLGRVILQDRVEIGANSTIDRGALGDTVIGEGTKIDNLVQIGHNCRLGRNCLIAAMSGLSGSTILGDGVLMGGGVGTSGHLTIGAGSVVHGRAAVTKDWPPGSKLAGAPAQDIRNFWRELATLRKLTKGDHRQ